MSFLLKYYLDKWWRPILYFALSIGLVAANEFIQNSIFGTIGFSLFGLGLFGLFVSSIYQLIKRRWKAAIVTGVVFGGIVAAILFYVAVMFFIETVDGDRWADNLKIPANIQLEVPIDLTMDYKRPDSISAISKSKIDFQLYSSFQPGLYEYDFWIGEIESGTIYLKAFEITQEYPLSADRLEESSAIKIKNSKDSIMKFSTASYFTIYEGDWGKPYAARFEVWFKPESGGKERKLFMKNYKIEGWQR